MVMTATAETITVEGMEIRFLVEGKDSAGTLAVFEFGVPAGVKIAVAHSHDGYDETVYGLEGVLSWTVNGEESELGEGEALVVPRGASTNSRTGRTPTRRHSRSRLRA